MRSSVGYCPTHCCREPEFLLLSPESLRGVLGRVVLGMRVRLHFDSKLFNRGETGRAMPRGVPHISLIGCRQALAGPQVVWWNCILSCIECSFWAIPFHTSVKKLKAVVVEPTPHPLQRERLVAAAPVGQPISLEPDSATRSACRSLSPTHLLL